MRAAVDGTIPSNEGQQSESLEEAFMQRTMPKPFAQRRQKKSQDPSARMKDVDADTRRARMPLTRIWLSKSHIRSG